MKIRKAHSEDFERIFDFYRGIAYTPAIRRDDDYWVAEDSGTLVGIARLSEENKVLVLRGMQVVTGMQRKGIGTALLKAITPFVGEKECFCIPYRHLVSFYRQAGFVEIVAKESPEFLVIRAADYKRKMDRDVIIMRKPGTRQP